MIHNDVLRRLRYALRLSDASIINLFGLVDYAVEPEYVHAIVKKESDQGFIECSDKTISLFLDGLIIKQRGKQQDREIVVLKKPEKITNNDILRKIKIAMNYRDTDIIDLLKSVDCVVSKTELSALLRGVGHRNYRQCGDQFLRNFLQGMVKKYRQDSGHTLGG